MSGIITYGRKLDSTGKLLTGPLALGPAKFGKNPLAHMLAQAEAFMFTDGALAITRHANGGLSGSRDFVQQFLPTSGAWAPSLDTKFLGKCATWVTRLSTTRQFHSRGVSAWGDQSTNGSNTTHGIFLRRYFRTWDALDCAPTQLNDDVPKTEVNHRRAAVVRSFPDGRLLVRWWEDTPEESRLMVRFLPQ